MNFDIYYILRNENFFFLIFHILHNIYFRVILKIIFFKFNNMYKHNKKYSKDPFYETS